MFAFHDPWWVYAVMPVAAALVGYVTKLLVIEMIFAPIEYRGVGPVGWQGIVPRRAAKMATITVKTLTEDLLDPKELFAQLDLDKLVTDIEGPLREIVPEMVRELAEDVRPGVWDSLPAAVRGQVVEQIVRSSRGTIVRLTGEVRANIDHILDLEHLVVTRLVTDKVLLTRVFRSIAGSEIKFMATAGGISGAIIGCLQVAAYVATGSHLVLPLFGLLTGGFTDWLALHMIFRPVKPGRLLGVFPWQGVFHARRAAITLNYTKIVTEELVTPQLVIDAILTGPSSDRLYALVAVEVERTIDEQLGLARGAAMLTVGTTRYEELKRRVAVKAQERMPVELQRLGSVAEQAALDELLADRMQQMTDDQYEELLRPVFRDDEKTVIIVGALLGFLVGELQVAVLL